MEVKYTRFDFACEVQKYYLFEIHLKCHWKAGASIPWEKGHIPRKCLKEKKKETELDQVCLGLKCIRMQNVITLFKKCIFSFKFLLIKIKEQSQRTRHKDDIGGRWQWRNNYDNRFNKNAIRTSNCLYLGFSTTELYVLRHQRFFSLFAQS